MMNVVAAAVFAVFVALVLIAAKTQARTWIHLLIAYAVAVTLGVGALQVELWPFSAWPLIAGYHPPTATHVHLTAIDDRGAEHEIDARAWGSLSMLELTAWLDSAFGKLSSEQKASAFAYLLDTVEHSRARAVAAGKIESPSPLASPYFILSTPFWSEALPRRPLVALRFYHERWDLERRARDPNAFTRELVYEYRRVGGAP